MNNKLKEIFHRTDFQTDDVCESKELGQNVTLQVLSYFRSFWMVTTSNGIVYKDWLSEADLTLKIPVVSLSDVLVKLSEKYIPLDYFKLRFSSWFIDTSVIELRFKDNVVRWQLKKSLWDQSDETKKAIEEILK